MRRTSSKACRKYADDWSIGKNRQVTHPHLTATIDLGAIAHNVGVIQSHVRTADIMAVVKADAYGHGLVPSARAAVAGGATWLGVALLSEALELRRAGVTTPILAWLYTADDVVGECLDLGIELAVNSTWAVDMIARCAVEQGTVARVHIKVDTGLGRNGVTIAELPEVVEHLMPHVREGVLEVTGVMSHFAYADEPSHPTVLTQTQVFTDALRIIRDMGLDPQHIHLANSAAIMALPDTVFTMVRPGIALFGVAPSPQVFNLEMNLKPAMRVHAPIALIKSVPVGTGVSYGHQYVTTSDTRLALVGAGYADGIPRHASNGAPLLIGGQAFSIAGRVCMDQFSVDIGDLDVHVGSDVCLFGDPSKGEPSVDDWALACDTINYEIMTRIGPRAHREFINQPW